MRISNIQIAGILSLLAIVLLVMMITHKREAPTPLSTETREQGSIDSYVSKLEQEREQELDEQAKAAKLAKLVTAKRNSVECQFWKQQKPSAKTTEKTKEACELPPTE